MPPTTPTTILGARIREQRRVLGVTQAEFARRIGISPSYLNLIEHNKRPIAGGLLRRIAEGLDMRPDELDGAAERRLMEALTEVSAAPNLRPLHIETGRTGEFIGRFPGWARAFATLARSERQAAASARALADRLTHDPFLGEAVHRMLTRIASIRSAAEILTDYEDIPADRRRRFHTIIFEESRILSDVGEALTAYFDKSGQDESPDTPLDEVEALLEANNNHFAELEAAAGPLHDRLDSAAPETRRAEAIALARARFGEIIEAIIASSPRIRTASARGRAALLLFDYGAGAILAPLGGFLGAALDLRFDVEALAERFALSIRRTCTRLTALPQTDGVPRFGYFRANAAGTIIEMRGLPGLAVPRYAAACPLWVLYRAQSQPETILRQRAIFPSGSRFVFLARARNVSPGGFGNPRHYLTDMLAIEEEAASATVYAPDPSVGVEQIGPACRICPRRSCAHRVEDPLAG